MTLLLQPADGQPPLTKNQVSALLSDLRAEGVEAELTEREPPFGELASFAQLWSLALELTPAAVAAGALLTKILPHVFKSLDVYQQQKVKIKIGSTSLEAPARMSHAEMKSLIEQLAASAEKTKPATKRRAKKTS